MNLYRTLSSGDRDFLQAMLYRWAGVFLFLYSLILTFAPAVRYHSWNVDLRWQHWAGFIVWCISAFCLNYLTKKKYPNRDPYLLPIISILMGLGLLTIFRLNVSYGWRQTIWFSLATCAVLITIWKSEYLVHIRRFKYIWLFLGLIITGLTFFFGIYPNGTGPNLWLEFGGLYIQPSEPLKLLFIVYLAAFLADQWPSRHNLMSLIVPTMVMGSAALLVLFAQRDLGTASIFILLYAFFIFLVTGKRRTLVIFVIILVAAGFTGYELFDVIRIRMEAWTNPWVDPAGRSYQIIQSIQAIAAGGILGSGPGLGSPGLIPVAISDFIFAAIVEELGFVGALAIFALFAFLAFRGFLITIKARNQYHQLLAAGITAFFSIQSILILGGNTRLLPLTGVTLPFISYGGSSLLTCCLAAALLLWVSQFQSTRPIAMTATQPYFFTLTLIILAFASLSLVTGWWSIIRADNLLSRTDNFRRVINDRYVLRGAILDRNNNPIAVTDGSVSEYTRLLNQPSLSATVGYLNPLYGLGGLESSMDPYLRGLQGLPSSTVWLNQLLYNQPPQGRDIRTSIDLNIQSKLVSSLENNQGAAVILNAQTGEVLALWTAPSFDANQLVENWESWKSDPSAPLVNRVTQGQYTVNTALAPFLIAQQQGYIAFNEHVTALNTCLELQKSINSQPACQTQLQNLIYAFPEEDIPNLISQFHWDESLAFALPNAPAVVVPATPDEEYLAQTLKLSPLQVAVSAAAFSQSGVVPAPRIANAVHTPHLDWVVFANENSQTIMTTTAAAATANLFARMDLPAWDLTTQTSGQEQDTQWYLSGTNPEWPGTPFILVIVLENGELNPLQIIGRSIMDQLMGAVP